MHEVSLLVTCHYQDIFDQINESIKLCKFPNKKYVVKSGDQDLKAPGWTILAGIEPYIGPRNGNIGIEAIKTGDILYANDDVSYMQTDTITELSRLAHSDPDIGLVSPVVHGRVGNQLQEYRGMEQPELMESRKRLSFVCIYLKRGILEKVGLLDERFTGYGGDDTDYSLRVQAAGYKLMVATRVQVKHGFGEYKCTATHCRMGTDLGGDAAAMEVLLHMKYDSVAKVGPGGYVKYNRDGKPFCCELHKKIYFKEHPEEAPNRRDQWELKRP